MFGGAAAGGGTAFESISTVNVESGGTSSVIFSSIPSTYKHLQLRYIVQTNRSTYGVDSLNMRVGVSSSDTGNNYSRHYLLGNGSTPEAAGSGTVNSWQLINGSATTTAGTYIFGAGVIDILDYQNTNKYKTLRALGGVEHNGSVGGYQTGNINFTSGSWQSTSAIGYIEITSSTSNTIQQYSQFALYGIKG